MRAKRPAPGEMNRTEAKFAEHLEGLKLAGQILSWRFEPMNLRLSKGCYYRIDFWVVMPDGCVEILEVKGTTYVKDGDSKPYCEDDALVKIKLGAEIFHEFTFRMAWWDKKEGWQFRDFGV